MPINSYDVRKQFLDFFIAKNHTLVPSAPIVLKNDPSLLFTNAGMNQFKDIFLGNKPAQQVRVVDTQKCLRVSGKHNDLEEVGVDTYHHTMFEMLGNWSFGDYFKKEAIAWAWELITEVYKIEKENIYVTIFEGDQQDNLPADEEAFAEWKKWIEADRIIRCNKKNNFWEMGDTGPCGPCSEIHIDCRSESEKKQTPGKLLVNADHPEVIEIWNLVFIQFNRLKDGTLQPLPQRHVDTGMGLERLVRVLSHQQSNYDSDLFMDTIKTIETICNVSYTHSETLPDVSFRVLADHVRAVAFCIADGQLPSNVGAGYVVRRILRRAARYYYSYLNYKKPLLCQLLPLLANKFETVFPEISQQQAFIEKIIQEEEESFLRTLEKGLRRFDEYIGRKYEKMAEEDPQFHQYVQSKLGYEPTRISKEEELHKTLTKKLIHIDGNFAFELYDTYGFPLDLTKLIAEQSFVFVVDEKTEEQFNKAMQRQKNRSKQAAASDTEDWVIVNETNKTTFLGYEQLEATTEITKYRKVKTNTQEIYQLVLKETPFYAQSGGQVGDTGSLRIGEKTIIVQDTKKENDLIIHEVEQIPLPLVHTKITAQVDAQRRQYIASHHTATHLLHAALKVVLGNSVQQKGSLVTEKKLRFDFAHYTKLTAAECQLVEQLVNQQIRANSPVQIAEMAKQKAMDEGFTALFGEKYGDTVRTVTIDKNFSKELCGGTHLSHTGQLGFFKITEETAVAAGVRRIEAVAGIAAEAYVATQLNQLQNMAQALDNPKDILAKMATLQQQRLQTEKQLEAFKQKEINDWMQTCTASVEHFMGINLMVQLVETAYPETVKKITTQLKNTIPNSIIVVLANIDGKAIVLIGLHATVIEKHNLSAVHLLNQTLQPILKARGGGQPAMAQGSCLTTVSTEVVQKIETALFDWVEHH